MIMKSFWIWFWGDFEIFHAMKQNLSREERGFDWPAYWHMDSWNKSVKFSHHYLLESPECFTVYTKCLGYVSVNKKKYPLNQEIQCQPGPVEIEIIVASMELLPCVYVTGSSIASDETWVCTNYLIESPVGTSSLYTKQTDDPNEIPFNRVECHPELISTSEGGLLYDFERTIDGYLNLVLNDETASFDICFGESEAEAHDQTWCYYKENCFRNGRKIRKRAFRYVFIPNANEESIKSISADHLYVDIPVKASFVSNNDILNQIWNISAETYRLCSGLFFIDGVKRDRWIWSGDAYQSYFVNPYLFFDDEIEERTITGLRGNTEIVQHLNTIVDYSLLWIVSIEKHIKTFKNISFLKKIWPRVKAMMSFCEKQLDENGFIIGRPNDWIFIDWADMDKQGPLVGEQMLLYASYKTMTTLSDLINDHSRDYEQLAFELKKKINKYFWREDKQAYIDSYESGKNNVTRHGNIFAILFDIADERRTESIVQNVLLNDSIPKITTPYFKFFELDVFGKTGRLELIQKELYSYWGGMIQLGAKTFWEQFDPTLSGKDHYEMYGDPFGKSLCHAWAASPIYLISRYFIGLIHDDPGANYIICPNFEVLTFDFDCVFPVRNGSVRIKKENSKFIVSSNANGGKLYIKNACYGLQDKQVLELSI